MNPIKQIREKLGYTRYNAAKILGLEQIQFDRLEASVQGYRYGYYLLRLIEVSGMPCKEIRELFKEAPESVNKNAVDKS
jgi:hypothetical protein